jgi:hypothetical protein
MSRSSVESLERTSALPASAPGRGSSVPERLRESVEICVDRSPKSSPWHGQEISIRPSWQLLTTPYCTLELDRRQGFLRFTRSEKPYPSLTAIELEAIELDHALERMCGARILVDLRAAAPRNDPEFEMTIKRLRRRLYERSERAAVLVRTAVGALQVKRHVREDGANVEVFQSEDDALAYLEGPLPESSRRFTALPPPPTSRSLFRGH